MNIRFRQAELGGDMNKFIVQLPNLLPYIWMGCIGIFIILETMTLGLTSIWFAFAAFVVLFLSLAKVHYMIQILMFSVLSLIFVLYTRPIVKKYLKVGENKTNIDAIIDEIGIVTKDIIPYSVGQVKVKGQIWTAKSIDNEALKVDSEVRVVQIEGVKLIVQKL